MSRTLLVAVLVFIVGHCPQLRAAPPAQVDEIVAHFGFFGYETETTEEFLRATHASNLNIAVKDHRGGILFLSFLGASAYAKENPGELTAFANSLNVNATVSRTYVDKDGDLALEAWFPGTYDKPRFSLFLEEWHRDTIIQLRERSAEVDKLCD